MKRTLRWILAIAAAASAWMLAAAALATIGVPPGAADQPTPIDKDSVLAFLKSDDVGQILGMSPSELLYIAGLFRDTGVDIPLGMGAAHVLRWLLGLAIEHGASWPSYAQGVITARQAVLTAKPGEPK